MTTNNFIVLSFQVISNKIRSIYVAALITGNGTATTDSKVPVRSRVTAKGCVLSSHFVIISLRKVCLIFLRLKSAKIYLSCFLFTMSRIPSPIECHYQRNDRLLTATFFGLKSFSCCNCGLEIFSFIVAYTSCTGPAR